MQVVAQAVCMNPGGRRELVSCFLDCYSTASKQPSFQSIFTIEWDDIYAQFAHFVAGYVEVKAFIRDCVGFPVSVNHMHMAGVGEVVDTGR